MKSARQRAWASRTGAWLRSIGRMYFLVFRAGDHDVVAPADGCEDARYALEGEEFFFADAGQHLLRVVVELAGFGACSGFSKISGTRPLSPTPGRTKFQSISGSTSAILMSGNTSRPVWAGTAISDAGFGTRSLRT